MVCQGQGGRSGWLWLNNRRCIVCREFYKTIKPSLSAFYYYHLPAILNNVSDKMPFLKISLVGLPLKLLNFNINNIYLCYIISVHTLTDMFIT